MPRLRPLVVAVLIAGLLPAPAWAARNGLIAVGMGFGGGCGLIALDGPDATTADEDCSAPSHSGIVVVRADGTGKRRLPLPPKAGDGRFSSDGQLLAFGTEASTFLATASGRSVRRIDREQHGLDWHPDSPVLAYARRPSGGSSFEIVRLHVRTMRKRVLGTGSMPRWSPSGRWIAYTRGTPIGTKDPIRVMIMRADGRHERVLKTFRDGTEPIVGSIDWLGWSEDGRSVVFKAATIRFSVDIVTGQVRRLPFLRDGVVSPDGRLRAFCGNERMWVSRRDGSARRALLDPNNWRASWCVVTDWQALP